MIYDHQLIMPDARAQISQDSGHRTLALLQTCRLIYAEAVGIFYSRNALSFPCTKSIAMNSSSVIPFIHSAWSDRLGAIRSVTLCKIPHTGFLPAIAVMQKAVPALEVLCLERKYHAAHANPDVWQDVAATLKAQLDEFPSLRELRFLEPEISGPRPRSREKEWQTVKRKRVLQIDDMLVQWVARRQAGQGRK